MDTYFIDLMKMVITWSRREERKPHPTSARLQLLNMERICVDRKKKLERNKGYGHNCV